MNGWNEALISAEDSIFSAIQVIDRQSTKAAFVVGQNNIFKGIVTDGDIRRGLLAGKTLSQKVEDVMNKSPLTCSPTDSHDTIKRLMLAKRLLHMPIIRDNCLIDVLTLQELTDNPEINNPVFLMAGGYGRRLQPLTDECPKPMLKVGRKPILETILNSFIDSGFKKFYISTHYLPKIIQDHFGDGSQWGVEINYTFENKPLGTGGALGLLPKNIGSLPIIMMNGDILTKVDFKCLLDYHNQSGAAVTMCVREHQHQVPYGVVTAEDFCVKKMIEKPVYRYHVNAGIYVINSEVVQGVNKDRNVDMPDILNSEILKGEKIATYPLDEYWLDIGRVNDFEQAQQDVMNIFK